MQWRRLKRAVLRENLPPVAAILCGVYRIDDHVFYLGADGNWNPYKNFGSFKESKATCLLGQSAENIFADNYKVMECNVQTLVEMGRSKDGRKLIGIYTDSNHRPLLKMRHVLFEVCRLCHGTSQQLTKMLGA